MEESDHCALSGEGALEFARSLENFEGICDPADLKGDYPFQKIHVTTTDFRKFTKHMFESKPVNERTVINSSVTMQMLMPWKWPMKMSRR